LSKNYRVIQEAIDEWRVLFYEDNEEVDSSLYATIEEAMMAGQHYISEYTGVLPWDE
jgi:hypothetical protein